MKQILNWVKNNNLFIHKTFINQLKAISFNLRKESFSQFSQKKRKKNMHWNKTNCELYKKRISVSQWQILSKKRTVSFNHNKFISQLRTISFNLDYLFHLFSQFLQKISLISKWNEIWIVWKIIIYPWIKKNYVNAGLFHSIGKKNIVLKKFHRNLFTYKVKRILKSVKNIF